MDNCSIPLVPVQERCRLTLSQPLAPAPKRTQSKPQPPCAQSKHHFPEPHLNASHRALREKTCCRRRETTQLLSSPLKTQTSVCAQAPQSLQLTTRLQQQYFTLFAFFPCNRKINECTISYLYTGISTCHLKEDFLSHT